MSRDSSTLSDLDVAQLIIKGAWRGWQPCHRYQPGLFMNAYYSGRSICPARLFSFGLRDGPQVRLRRPQLREAAAGFGLSRFATAFTNNPGQDIKEVGS
jgi:hypothetical protein